MPLYAFHMCYGTAGKWLRKLLASTAATDTDETSFNSKWLADSCDVRLAHVPAFVPLRLARAMGVGPAAWRTSCERRRRCVHGL